MAGPALFLLLEEVVFFGIAKMVLEINNVHAL
jgi:hypothetical protein